jgi:hypothetical protein
MNEAVEGENEGVEGVCKVKKEMLRHCKGT